MLKTQNEAMQTQIQTMKTFIKQASLWTEMQCRTLMNYIHVTIVSLVPTPIFPPELEEPLTEVEPGPCAAVEPSEPRHG